MGNEARWPKMMRCVVRHPQESLKGSNNIDCLSDELLAEILGRLPNHKSVIQCKCVCKRWAALASHPSFIGQFIGLKLGYGSNGGIDLNKEHEKFAIVMRYEPDGFRELWQEFENFFRPSIFDPQDSSLSPLHSCLGDVIDNTSGSESESARLRVVASCKDLLLYSRHENNKFDYLISNVQTKKWFVLPSPSFRYEKYSLIGFICDPFFSSDSRNKDIIVINPAYHYSVVVVPCSQYPSTKFRAHLFSSHCGSQWCDRVLSLPKTCRLMVPEPSCSFCFDGKLHFYCCGGIVGFDHNSSFEFDDEIQCHLVEWPVGMSLVNLRVGVSQGNLHVSNFARNDTNTDVALSVWVLKDYKTGNWVLQHRVEMREWVSVSRDSWMTKELEDFSRHPGRFGFLQVLVNGLGFHPTSSHLLYLLVPGSIFLCNLSTKTVELACHIPVAAGNLANTRKHYLRKVFNFPVILQSWPTPFPPLACSGLQG